MPEDTPNRSGHDDAAAAERSGEDLRRRGWFWHWNTIITQYVPLVGLKGVGLLNSYTVWTDRRDESPHRGYAFPSQQSEADFYGEDRAELITINKILVALDLIEIRKEMVQRVDERGRRWRVPHNLYRVKDHRDGYSLTPEDVMRVAELAARDRAVYRYIRRVFSPRFTPIDRDNVWHQILPAVRQTERWQQLAERAEREEARASARTKAGHAKRARTTTASATDNGEALADAEFKADDLPANDIRPSNIGSNVGTGDNGLPPDVASTNSGFAVDVDAGNSGSSRAVAPGNQGSGPIEPSIADRFNEGTEEAVDQSNRTYYQDRSTTTTTTTEPVLSNDQSETPPGAERTEPSATLDPGPVFGPPLIGATSGGGVGPLPEPALAVLTAFQAANDRDASPLERELLAELETAFDDAACRAGASGPAWVEAAIREAVSSGSRFVAPKRIREILSRWSMDAAGAAADAGPRQASDRPDRLRPGGTPAATTPGVVNRRPAAPAPTTAGDLRLSDGSRGSQVWDRTLRLLSQVIDQTEMLRLFDGSAIVDDRAGTVTVQVAAAESASRLGGEYYDLVARKLRDVLRRPVRLRFVVASESPPSSTSASVVTSDVESTSAGGADQPAEALDAPQAAGAGRAPSRSRDPAAGRIDPSRTRFVLPGGLSNVQVWAATQDELTRRLTPANVESWVRPSALIGIDEADGALIVGAPNAFAQRRLHSFLPEIRAALRGILGGSPEVRIAVAGEWLRDHAMSPRAQEDDQTNPDGESS